jgi:outer membrane protein assembly factor BamD
MSIPTPRRALIPVLLVALAGSPALAQEGTGHSSGEDEVGDSRQLVKRKGDRLTRKEKKEQKRLQKEQEQARKDQRKWEKMGLAAQTAAQWYAEALRRYEEGKYLQAREILLPLEDSPRALEVQDKVKLLIADTYYYQGGALNLAEALARYRTFLTFYPSSEHAEYARFQMGNCYYKQLGPADRDQSYTDNAIVEYSGLLRDFPNGEHADMARERMLEAKALRARHEFDVAKFYLAWGNHEAAAARLEDLLKNRPESPDREEALYLLANSLHRLGRGTEAQAYAARLEADYPSSKYAGKVRPVAAGKAAGQLAKKDRKRDKESERTFTRQRKREDKRTRQLRKDSGLPARLPESGYGSGGGEVQAATVALASAPAPAERSPKEEKKARKQREKMERLEAEEQEQRRKELEREMRAEEKARAAAAEPKTEKQLKKERQAAEKAAKKAEKEARAMEKAEAAEQEELRKQEERERKQAEKRAKKEAEKAEKEQR